MREFKFRAFHESVGMWYIDDLYWFEEQGVHEMDDSYYKFMQFTGLKDKNGKEIYEGDIVKYGTPFHGKIETILTGKIIYNDYCGAFQIAYKNINDIFVTDFCHRFTILEVIGNIYQNPELL